MPSTLVLGIWTSLSHYTRMRLLRKVMPILMNHFEQEKEACPLFPNRKPVFLEGHFLSEWPPHGSSVHPMLCVGNLPTSLVTQLPVEEDASQ